MIEKALPVFNDPPGDDAWDAFNAPGEISRPSVRNRMRETRRASEVAPSIAAPAKKKDAAWIRRQAGYALWSAQWLMRHGLPQGLYYYDGGIGDELLMTTVFHEMAKRGMPRPSFMSRYPSLFTHNPDLGTPLPWDARLLELYKALGRKPIYPCYMYEKIAEADVHYCPPYPMVARMCKMCKIFGSVDIRPYFYLTDDEKHAGQVARRQVAIMSSGMSALHKHLNKQWLPERYQAVVHAFQGQYDFVQVGDASDPPLEGALDLRGKTSIRQTAAVLSQSLLFVGQIGFLMHLARAVDCRAVIVYGGREMPFQSGYTCNENLYTPLTCSPCWKENHCDFGRECLTRIQPEHVIAAIGRQMERAGEPLALDSYTILPE